MSVWWSKLWPTGQKISQSEIGGSVVQIGPESDVVITIEPPGQNSPDAGSISPPVDHLGRPFHGREELVSSLIGRVVEGDSAGRVEVLCGLGGCGKSMLAMTLAQTALEQGMNVWWITANTAASLHAGMRQLAITLGAPFGRVRRAWSGHESAIDLVWSQLRSQEQRWLLILDNADDPGLLSASGADLAAGTGWIRPPPDGNGVVVATTRNTSPDSWAPWCSLRRVGMLSPQQGAAVLMDYAGSGAGTRSEAARLARRLGGLPLALRLAGVHLAANTRLQWPGTIRTYGSYINALEQNRPEVIYPELEGVDGMADREARQLIGLTWDLSLRLLESKGFSEARPLLQMLAHFGEAPIPISTLSAQVIFQHRLLNSLTDSRLRDVSVALGDLGLVEIRTQSRPADAAAKLDILLHPLVRDVSRFAGALVRPGEDYLAAVATMTARALGALPQPEQPETWPDWQAHSPHAFFLLDEVTRLPEAESVTIDVAAYCAYQCARFLMSQAEFEGAERRYRQALEAMQSVGDARHPSILMLRHELALVAGARGRLSEAERNLDAIILDKIAAFGEDSDETLVSRHAYAGVLWQQRRLSEAEAEYRAIMAVYERQDRYTRSTLGTHHNLTQVLLEQGKLTKAQDEVQKVIAREEGLGDTVSLLRSRFIRSKILHAQGKYAEAIDKMRNLVEEHSTILGQDHPDTLAVLQEMGVVLQESGAPNDAVEVLRRVLIIRTKSVGSDHPDTLSTRHQLALALQESGNTDEAAIHYRATLKRRGEVLGPDSQHTLATRFQLATLLELTGRSSDARLEFEQILDSEIKALGADHPSTLTTRLTLAEYVLRDGKFQQALSEMERVLAVRRSIFGDNHPLTRSTRELIAAIRPRLPVSSHLL